MERWWKAFLGFVGKVWAEVTLKAYKERVREHLVTTLVRRMQADHNDQLDAHRKSMDALGQILNNATAARDAAIASCDDLRKQKVDLVNYLCALVRAAALAARQMRITRAGQVSNAQLAQWRSDLMFEAMSGLLMLERLLPPNAQPTWFVDLAQDVYDSPAAPAAAKRILQTDRLNYHREDLVADQLHWLIDLSHMKRGDAESVENPER